MIQKDNKKKVPSLTKISKWRTTRSLLRGRTRWTQCRRRLTTTPTSDIKIYEDIEKKEFIDVKNKIDAVKKRSLTTPRTNKSMTRRKSSLMLKTHSMLS